MELLTVMTASMSDLTFWEVMAFMMSFAFIVVALMGVHLRIKVDQLQSDRSQATQKHS